MTEKILNFIKIVVTDHRVLFYEEEEVWQALESGIPEALASIQKLEESKELRVLEVNKVYHAVIYVPAKLFCPKCDRVMKKYPDCRRCFSCGNISQDSDYRRI